MTDEWTAADVRDHYNRIRPVMEELADVDGLTPLCSPMTDENYDWKSWYTDVPGKTPDGWEANRIPHRLVDLDAVLDEHPDDGSFDFDDADELNSVSGILPLVQGTTGYYDPEEISASPSRRTSDGVEWKDGKPTPGYNDLGALTLFADIDFDGKKTAMGAEKRESIESIIESWIDVYADVVGTTDAVFALDSVGGTYIMVSPAATRPIAEEFPEDRGVLYSEIRDRWVDRLTEADEDLSVDDFGLDGQLNKNRLFKLPLIIHKQLPGVVTPIDVTDVDFSFTRVDDVDDDLIADTQEWAERFTSADHRECVGTIVHSLFPDVDGDDWTDVLENVIEQKEKERERRLEQAQESGDWDFDSDVDVEFVTEEQRVYDAVESLSPRQVCSAFALTTHDEKGDSDEFGIDPNAWRSSDSGKSCVATERASPPGDKSPVLDQKESEGGRAIDLAAWCVTDAQPGDDLSTDEYWDAVEELRDAGVNIPVFIKEADGDGVMPTWALNKYGRKTGLMPDDASVRTSPTLFNRVLDALEDEGFDHGRNRGSSEEVATDGGPAAAPAEVAVAEAVTDSDENTSDDANDDCVELWAARLGLTDRPYFGAREHTDSAVYWNINLPGIDDRFVWYEKWDGETCVEAGYGFHTVEEQTNDEGEVIDHTHHYNLIANHDVRVEERIVPVDGGGDQFRVTIRPTMESARQTTFDVEAGDFLPLSEYRNNIVSQNPAAMLWSQGEAENVANALKMVANMQDVARTEEVDSVGLLPDEQTVVLPNGCVTEDGWSDQPEYRFLAGKDSQLGRMFDLEEGTYDEDEVRRAAELLPKIRPEQNWLPVLGYVFASSFRPVVDELAKAGEVEEDTWPHVKLSGATGAGKSTSLERLYEALGITPSLLSASMTPHSAIVTMSDTDSIPLFLDEYKPNEIPNNKLNALHQVLKKSMNRNSHQKGTPTGTTTYTLSAPAIVVGEQKYPKDKSALRRRAIRVKFLASIVGDSEYDTTFTRLTGGTYTDSDGEMQSTIGVDLSHHAQAWWRYVAANSDQDTVAGVWSEAGEMVRTVVENRAPDGSSRPADIWGLQTITFGWMMWRNFATSNGADPEEVTTESDMEQAIETTARRMWGRDSGSTDDVHAFLSEMARAASKTDIRGSRMMQKFVVRGEHYKIVNPNDGPWSLRIDVEQTLDGIREAHSRHGDAGTNLLQAEEYEDRFEDRSKNDEDDLVIGHSVMTHGLSKRVVSVDMEEVITTLGLSIKDFKPTEQFDLDDGEDVVDAVLDDGDDGDGDSDDGDGESSAAQNMSDRQRNTLGDIETDSPDADESSTSAPETATDGGGMSQLERRNTVKKTVGSMSPVSREAVLDEVVQNAGADRQKAEHTFESLVEAGEIYESAEDEWRQS